MQLNNDIVEQISVYTGKKWAIEWYQAIFEPKYTESTVRWYIEHINGAELQCIIRRASWKKSKAQILFEEIAHCLARGWGIGERNYPEIVLHDVKSALGSHECEFALDEKCNIIVKKLHFDIDAMIQRRPSAEQIIGEIAHEMVHFHQLLKLHSWTKWYPYLNKRVMDRRILRIIFGMNRLQKPKYMLYWLNQQIYLTDVAEAELYPKQILEREAFGVAENLEIAVVTVWNQFNDNKRSMPALS